MTSRATTRGEDRLRPYAVASLDPQWRVRPFSELSSVRTLRVAPDGRIGGRMRIAITGGSGFVGRHLARRLLRELHEVVLVSRGADNRDPTIRGAAGVHFAPVGLDDEVRLADAFAGCAAVAHCAGINREIGE